MPYIGVKSIKRPKYSPAYTLLPYDLSNLNEILKIQFLFVIELN